MRIAAIIAVTGVMLAGMAACRHGSARAPEVVPDRTTTLPDKSEPPPPLPPLSPELATSLNGRTIFLDPGHGGPFTGMIAPSNGIHEADVNLNVALHVRDRLESHGATVLMSREDDTVLIPDSLSRDLSARAAVSNETRPDVFLSIHHNADVVAGSQKDDLEVYYKLGDSMASLDLGQHLIAALSRGIRYGSAEKLLLPGNYKVLRENEAPSLLLETAYLTNDRDAAYLATPQGVDDESRSIVHGLATYFAMEPPRIHRVVDHHFNPNKKSSLRLRFENGLPIDLDTVTVQLDGSRLSGDVMSVSDGFEWFPHAPLPNGDSNLVISGRNDRGAAFRVYHTASRMRAPASIQITQSPIPAGSGNRVRFEVRVLDGIGTTARSGTNVKRTAINDVNFTRHGAARFYYDSADLPESVSFKAGEISATLNVEFGERAFQTAAIEDAISGESIQGAMAYTSDDFVGAADELGWIALPMDAGAIQVTRNGYEELQYTPAGTGHVTLKMIPRHNGALLGKRIAIDPAHGGREPGARAFDGSRASDLNLDTAWRLATLLERSGAEVFVTRSGDDEASDLNRIVATESFKADLLLVISFGAPVEETRPLNPTGHLRHDLTAFVGHYPQSVNGIRAANAIAKRLGIPTTACVSYMVQQSQSPALHVQPASLDMRPPSDAPLDAGALRAVADAVHDGLIEYFSDLETDP